MNGARYSLEVQGSRQGTRPRYSFGSQEIPYSWGPPLMTYMLGVIKCVRRASPRKVFLIDKTSRSDLTFSKLVLVNPTFNDRVFTLSS